MTNMNKEVVFKMHLVETAPEAHDEYLNARRGQMITAVAIEDGTFGMYASARRTSLRTILLKFTITRQPMMNTLLLTSTSSLSRRWLGSSSTTR